MKRLSWEGTRNGTSKSSIRVHCLDLDLDLVLPVPLSVGLGSEESPEILQILAALSTLGYFGELDSGLLVGGIVPIEVTSFLCRVQFP